MQYFECWCLNFKQKSDEKNFMIKYVLALLLVGFQALAFDVHREGDRLTLRGECNEGGNLVKALSVWSDRAATGKQCSPTSQNDGLSPYCKYDITSCVPEHVVKYQGANPKSDGPNCWNLSLVMSQILPSLRYSTPEEMQFYMQPPLCRQLSDGEKREPGDVGAIRHHMGSNKAAEYHGFIYISEKIAYSKNGASKYSPYSLQSLEDVYKAYDVPRLEGCRKNEINDGAAFCKQAVAYFRCQSMDEYLKNNPKVSNQVKEAFEKVKDTESCLQGSVFKGENLPEEAKKNIIETGNALLKYLEDSKKDLVASKTRSEEERFMLGSLQLRLQAIAQQIDFNNSNPFGFPSETSDTLMELANSIQQSQKELPETR